MWQERYDSLRSAEAAEDLEQLATAAYMLGRYLEHVAVSERAHLAHLDAGEPLRAARCAIWIGFGLVLRGEISTASGWFGRAGRLVAREQEDCVERGYLLIPKMFELEAGGHWEEAETKAAAAVEIAHRFDDADLFGLAVHEQGHIRIRLGRIADGLRLLDEAMVAVVAGELSPIASGIVYCGVILACRDAYEARRAREWTAALTRWCEEQPDLVPFTGQCLVHRAQIQHLSGAWRDALEEARKAGERCEEGNNPTAAGAAHYLEGEVRRVQGDFAAAEASYRDASRCGCEPQPGLALLTLAQGDQASAEAAIRRALGETTARAERAALLPAFVEIMLAAGDVEEAREACNELDGIAAAHTGGMLGPMAARCRGAADLAAGDAGEALPRLRRAAHGWQELGAPYEVARARALVGLACRALGDDVTASLELEAAEDAFEELGAGPDLQGLAAHTRPGHAGVLTRRELEVLRLVAAGETNKAIAAQLVLSERTIDRHVSNILAKLRVPSRAAATAYAYEHKLL